MIDQLKKQLNNPDSLVSLFLGIAVVVVTGVLIFNYVRGRNPQTSSTSTTNTANTTPGAQPQGAGAANKTLPTTHTVVAGDTLWSIAEKHYGSGYNWVDIQAANKMTNPDNLENGQKLTVPNVPKKMASAAMGATGNKPATDKYTVKHGDTLWQISTSVYGTGYRWGDIARRNNLMNPNIIHAGNVLTMP